MVRERHSCCSCVVEGGRGKNIKLKSQVLEKKDKKMKETEKMIATRVLLEVLVVFTGTRETLLTFYGTHTRSGTVRSHRFTPWERGV